MQITAKQAKRQTLKFTETDQLTRVCAYIQNACVAGKFRFYLTENLEQATKEWLKLNGFELIEDYISWEKVSI